MNENIRPVTIAEHADLAAQRTAATGEIEPNPHEPGSNDHARWHAAYSRYLLKHSAPDCESSS